MSDTIDALLQQATDRSAQLPAPITQGGAVQAARPQRAPSLDDMLTGGMTVENWLKVNENGLVVKVETDQALMDNLKVTIDMPEVVATQAIKYGSPPTYHKTFDGVMCADGQTLWTDAIEEGARFGSRPYPSADIPMTLAEDVVDRKGKVIMTAGQRLGYSLSTTNRDAFTKFLRTVTEQDLREAVVVVNLGYEVKTNKAKQTWGIVTFDCEGEAAPE